MIWIKSQSSTRLLYFLAENVNRSTTIRFIQKNRGVKLRIWRKEKKDHLLHFLQYHCIVICANFRTILVGSPGRDQHIPRRDWFQIVRHSTQTAPHWKMKPHKHSKLVMWPSSQWECQNGPLNLQECHEYFPLHYNHFKASCMRSFLLSELPYMITTFFVTSLFGANTW